MQVKKPKTRRFKLEIFSQHGPEIQYGLKNDMLQAAASWYSRGVKVKLTDTQTGKILYGATC